MERKIYSLPRLNKGIMVLTLATLMIAALVAGFALGRNHMAWADADNDLKMVILPLLVALPLFLALKPLYMRSYRADLSGGRLRITTGQGREIYDGPLQNVHTIRVSDVGQNYVLRVWDRNSAAIITVTCNMLTPGKRTGQVREFVAELIRLTGAEKGEAMAVGKFSAPAVYYHSTMPCPGEEARLAPEGLKQQLRSRNRKAIAAVVVGFVAVMAGLIWVAAASKGVYEIDELGVVTFRGRPVEGAVAKEFRNLTYLTAKDSSHVYFRGKVQPGLDARTIRSLNSFLLADRGGIYREPSFPVFSSGLKRLEGVDYTSFRALGNSLFADREHVFYLDVFASNPVVAVSEEPRPDPATTVEVGVYFFKDSRRVYFMPTGGARPRYCSEIDAPSFEQVSWQVYKDGERVYFVTFGLTQEGGNQQAGYDVLRGADAPTFHMVDHNVFEDKNTAWTIEKSTR
ncbi:hypothetical protein FACS1894159_07840 [Bacteroidia bacterium]|nr:hypothetical protein FACS1894159_07840 [Bacteroidia bacterium]